MLVFTGIPHRGNTRGQGNGAVLVLLRAPMTRCYCAIIMKIHLQQKLASIRRGARLDVEHFLRACLRRGCCAVGGVKTQRVREKEEGKRRGCRERES